MKKMMYLGMIALLIGCASETEQKSLNRIGEIYDANTSYTKGFSSSAGQETIKRFTIKAKESAMIDTLNPNAVSANMALMVYDGFETKEKDDYTHIHVELVTTKNDTTSYTFPIDLLEKLSAKATAFHRFSQSVLDGNASELDAIINPEQIPDPIGERVMTNMTRLKNEHGALLGYDPYALSENRDKIGSVYRFLSHFTFSNGAKVPYYVVVDVTPGKNLIEGFRIFQ